MDADGDTVNRCLAGCGGAAGGLPDAIDGDVVAPGVGWRGAVGWNAGTAAA